MTRALLVERDPIAAERIGAALELAGYIVSRCPGPSLNGCPVLEGCGCALVERADVLVYDIEDARTGSGGRSLIGELRSLYGDHGFVLFGSDHGRGPTEVATGSGVVRVRGEPDVVRLTLAVEDALANR